MEMQNINTIDKMSKSEIIEMYESLLFEKSKHTCMNETELCTTIEKLQKENMELKAKNEIIKLENEFSKKVIESQSTTIEELLEISESDKIEHYASSVSADCLRRLMHEPEPIATQSFDDTIHNVQTEYDPNIEAKRMKYGNLICTHGIQKQTCKNCEYDRWLMGKVRSMFRHTLDKYQLYDTNKRIDHNDYLGCSIKDFAQYIVGMAKMNPTIDKENVKLEFTVKPEEFKHLHDEDELRQLFHFTNIHIKENKKNKTNKKYTPVLL